MGSIWRPGAWQADRDRLSEQLHPEDRGLAGAGSARPAGDCRRHPLSAGAAGERRRDLHLGQRERRQHESGRPAVLGVQRRRQCRLGTRFLGQIPARDRVGRRQSAGVHFRLRQHARAARCAGCGHLRRHPVCGGTTQGRARKRRPPAARPSDHRRPVSRRRCRRARRAPGAHPAAGDPGDDPAVGDRTAAGKECPQYAVGSARGRPCGNTGPAAGRDSGGTASPGHRRPDRSAATAARRAPGGIHRGDTKRGGRASPRPIFTRASA